ncbi:MAG: hypothetical protein KC613_26855, partial [Myxococcales bacterium]|nr:hypothetical protein [Myxococcales bacterium]
MKTPPVHLGSTPFHAPAGPVGWAHVTHAGQPWLRVTNVDAMPPFFMSVVSDSDPWLFVGSNGAFVGGRVQPDSALFPYLTVDRILERPDSMGARTALLVRRGAAWALWEPWQPSGRAYALTRTLYKHAHGTAVVFEETNHDLGLRLRSELTTCEDYGLLRLSQLAVLGDRPVEVRLLDGWHQLQPPGLNTRLMAQLSYLAAAYMRHERVPGRPLGLYTLNARLSDLAEPAESLRAAAGWVVGLDDATLLLSDRQIQAFRRGEGVASETEIRGAAGACYAVTQRRLQPGEPLRWIHGADTELDHAAVVRLRAELADPIAFAERVRAAAHANHRRLLGRIAAADGLQQTADAQASVHHFANVLFNCMRGGTLAAGYGFPRADLQAFLASRSRAVAARHAAGLAALPDPCTLPALHAFAAAQGDPALARLANEYLPLTFSR